MALALLGLLLVSTTGRAAVTLATRGATAPTPGSSDVAQLSIAGQANNPDGLNYYTDNQTAYGSGEPGQSFLTPAGSTGYTLTSLAIKTGGGSTFGTTTPQNYMLHIYSVNNGTVTLIATYNATNFVFNDGDWLQWSNLSVSLAANSLYAYSFGKMSGAVSGYEAMANASGNPYSGGEIGLFPVAGGSITVGSSHNYDAAFDVGLVPSGPVVTLATLGSTAPTPGLSDVSQLSIAGQANNPDGLNYYTDNQVSFGSGEPGQSFLTPSGSAGFTLTSLAIRTGGGTTSGTTTPQSYVLHIYSVNNGVATLITNYNVSNFVFNDGDWLQWSNLSVSLAANSLYAYSFGKMSGTVAGWEAMANAANNLYAGGELGLFPVAGGSITVGSSHNYDAAFDVGLVPSGPPTAPIVTNLPASAIQAVGAALNGKIVSSGGSQPYVTIFYGTNDGSANVLAWSNNATLGAQTGNFSASVTGLQPNTTYYFAAQASNAVGIAWAQPSLSFTTPTAAPPSVTNQPASGISATFATVNGLVLNTGNEYPTARIYYGPTDGGSNPSAWANQFSAGPQTGAIAVQVGGLTASTAYYFTISVSNSAAVAWGGPSQSFTTLAGPQKISVLTYHYDNTRQGLNPNETLLTPANVNTASFGKLFSYAVDGYVYAQPLILTNLAIPGKGVRNVLFVSTMHDSVYAFDADSNGDVNGGLLWKTNLGTSVNSPTPEYGTRYHGVGNLDVVPEEGTVGTPVIDPASGTIYMDAFTREVVAGVSTNYYHRIHALDITTGNERSYSPVVVAGSVTGTGVNGSGGVAGGGSGTTIIDGGPTVTFSAIQSCGRPALTLAGGILYAAFGSHDDTDPYHGWVFGYNVTNLSQVSIYCTTPNARLSPFGSNAGEGAIWQGGNGLLVDANTNLYFETGNGSFSANTNGGDYADSFVKLSTVSNKLAVADYFTPYNQASLQSSDADLGSGGPLLLPDSVGSVAHPHLLVGCGKEGKIYLVDRDNMGRFNSGSDTNVQELPGAVGGTWSSPAYFNGQIYYHGNGDVLKAFTISNGALVSTPASKSSTGFGFPGATPTVSANGTNDGIVWDIDPTPYLSSGPAVLHAYNATNVAIELYNSSQNLSRDNPGPAVKMVPPVIAGGKVYVGAQYAVSVFGTAIFLATPVISPAGGNFTNATTVTLSDTTAGVSIYYTLNGTAPSTASTLYTGPFVLTSSAVVQAMVVANGAINSAIASASFINTAAVGNGTGLRAEYFTNASSGSPFTGSPVLVTTNATVNFSSATNWPGVVVGSNHFAVRWTGSVQPQFSETYNFITTADDGVRLFINGQLLINDWVDKTNATSRTNSISLAAQQFYTIELDYYQATNNASVTLAWSSLSAPFSVVPQTQLYPFTNPPPTVAIAAPLAGASYTAAASVTISADADAPNNPINGVSFYANNIFLGSVGAVPYTLTVTGLAAGSYALTAVATDGSGLSSTSAVVNITVNAGSGLAYGLSNNAPVRTFLNMPTTFAGGPIPAQLSLTGVFSNTPAMIPTNGLIPYTVNTPLWSDGALKTRYLAIPNNGGTLTPDQQIGFDPNNPWTFPAGSVFVKTFELNTDTTNPNIRHRLETRLLVRDINGGVYGVTYKWRADNSDADLLSGSLTEAITITNTGSTTIQSWYYPSPADCLTCHTPVSGYVLGVKTRQLNLNQTYAATGVTDNQLRALNRLGFFNPAFDESAIASFQQLAAITNLSASLEWRARSYLDANCSQCHQPGGTGPTFDARFTTPLASQNLINGGLDSDGFAMIVPKDIWRSEIPPRMNTNTPAVRMPPLARNLIDTNAVQVMFDWINSLDGTPAEAPPNIAPYGGNYFNSVAVVLAAPDTNAVIYYTLDGTAPTTNSLLYAGPFNVTVNATLAASAFRTNYNNSVAATALFFITPVQFIAANFATNGQFQLGFLGITASNYVLQASTNLMNWTAISTNTAPTNVFYLFDPKATNFPERFYRVLQQ